MFTKIDRLIAEAEGRLASAKSLRSSEVITYEEAQLRAANFANRQLGLKEGGNVNIALGRIWHKHDQDLRIKKILSTTRTT